MSVVLAELGIFPIKSCGGINAKEWTLNKYGLAYDREWMLVTSEGKFITQREKPEMARIRPSIADGNLRVDIPGAKPLALKLDDFPEGRMTVTVWSDECVAAVYDTSVNEEFSRFLKIECRLVRMLPEHRRRSSTVEGIPAGQTGFSDGYPLTIVSLESLADLNDRLSEKVPMDRFRTNLIVKGCKPYEEESWKKIQIGSVEIDCVRPRARCIIINTDQNTSERAAEPLKILTSYRRRGGKVYFAEAAIHRGEGLLRVGMSVEVLEI